MADLSTKVKRTLQAGLVLALPAGSLLTTPSAAQAATCGAHGVGDDNVSGNAARWDVLCSGGNVAAKGWVKDNSADGYCARVKFYFPATGRWKYSPRACPQGETQRFDIGDQGYVVNGYIYEEP